MSKKVLVTGGAGYVGTFVVNDLLQKGYKVVVLDSLVYGDEGLNTYKSNKNLKFHSGDISELRDVEKAIKGVDYVIALAAIVGDPACSLSNDHTWKINLDSTKILLKAAKKNNIKKIIFASSCSVYGSSEASEINILDENSILNPVSNYAETRVLSEDLLLSPNNRIPSTVLRLSTVFGLSPRMRFDLAVNIMTAKAIKENHIEVFGGEQWRPFVHVRDAAMAFVTAMEAPSHLIDKEIFNVGSSDSNYQIKDIAEIINEEIPKTVIKNNTSMTDIRNYHVSFNKIHKKLNFKNEYSVRDGIREIKDFVIAEDPKLDDKKYNNYKTWKEIISLETFLPYAVPDVGEEEIEEVAKTIKSGWLTSGPKTKKFEDKVKDYFEDDSLEVIPVSSCTAALHLQLIAAGVGPGDEVITTPMTFCATINSILYTGAIPRLVDINPMSLNLDLSKLEEAISDKTKAIVPVYYGGQALDRKVLTNIAKKNDLFILADAAHAMGAKYDDMYCGTYEDSAAFSFYATKNLAIGEGGMITTHNKDWAEKIRRISLHGMNKDAWKRYSSKGNWFYDISDIGYKYNFTDIQASIGLHQLEKIDYMNNKRREYAEIYDQAFSKTNSISVQKIDPKAFTNRHLYPIFINKKKTDISREELINKLKENNIGTSVHYVPIHHHSAYKRSLEINENDFQITNDVYERMLSLPLYPKMTKEDISRVASKVIEIVS